MGRRNVITGTNGDDDHQGTDGKDKISTGRGDDTINAGGGNDIIKSGSGNDIVNGGSGHDCIHTGRGDDHVTAGSGHDYVRTGKGNDTASGGSGNDYIHLGRGDDTAIYVMGANTENSDFYHGGKGEDTLVLSLTLQEWLRADVQADIAAYTAFLNGEKVPDGYWHNKSTFQFKAFDLTAKGFETLKLDVDGEDLDPEMDAPVIIDRSDSNEDEVIEVDDDQFVFIQTSSGDDEITAGDGGGIINVGDGQNTVSAGDGGWEITGGEGDDVISTGDGDDIHNLGNGDDISMAGDGSDTIIAGEGGGNDIIDGSLGNDTVTYPSTSLGINIDLNAIDRSAVVATGGDTIGALLSNAGYEADTLVGLATGSEVDTDILIDIENVTAGTGDDTITGNQFDNILDGDSGNDLLSGGAGNDTLLGGEDDDIAIYVVSDNQSNQDNYDGEQGTDTLRLVMTRAEWLMPAVQTDISAFLNHIISTPEQAFQFNAFDLTAQNFETLEVIVDGQLLDPADEAVLSIDDNYSVNENGVLNDNVSLNDSVPDLISNAQLISGVANGSLVFNNDGTFSFNPNVNFETLAAGESAFESFTYQITDADGDTDNATASLEIIGQNDAPLVSLALQDQTITEGDSFSLFSDAAFTDIDTSDTLTYTANLSNGDPLPGWLSFNETTGEFSGTADPVTAAGEILEINVTASDGAEDVTDTFTLTIENGNAAPVAADFILEPQIEFLVNDITIGNQNNPNITALENGNFVVIWESDNQQNTDLALDDLKAKIFDQNGTVINSEFQINELGMVDARDAQITGLQGSNFVVTWQSSSRAPDGSVSIDIKARIFDQAGTPLTSELMINEVTAIISSDPIPTGTTLLDLDITTLSDGKFVISWSKGPIGFSEFDFSDAEITARILNADGSTFSGELVLNQLTTDIQRQAVVHALDNGGFVATWKSDGPQQGDTSGSGIKARIFDNTGTAVGNEFLVNELVADGQGEPDITQLANGNLVFTWVSEDPQQGDTDGEGIKARIFNADGTTLTNGSPEFLINQFTNDDQDRAKIIALANGGFVVTWVSDEPEQGDTDEEGIKARVFDNDGNPVNDEFLVNQLTVEEQEDPSIAPLANGGFVITFESELSKQGDASSDGVKARIFDENGNSIDPVFENSIYSIDGADLLALATDAENDPLDIASVAAVSDKGATVALNPDGTISYDPGDIFNILTEGQTTTDTFTYTITDDQGNQDTATVTLTIFGQNEAPVTLQASYDLSDIINGTIPELNGFSVDGENSDDESAEIVTGLGDINGDGIDDFAISAEDADPNGMDGAGKTYVIYGSDVNIPTNINLSNLNSNIGFVLNGIDTGDGSSEDISSGDINGDGINDIIIGADSADPSGLIDAGETYVIFGSNNGFGTSFDLSSLALGDGSTGFVINGEAAGDRSGSSLTNVGDINNDGFDDIAIGARRPSTGDAKVYVVYGSDAGFSANLNLADLDGSNGFVINGISSFDSTGDFISFGDLNSDGASDLVISASRADPDGLTDAGAAYVVYGYNGFSGAPFSASFDLSNLDGTNGFAINGLNDGDQLGSSVSFIGDINDDNYDDFIIGSSLADANGITESGAGYVIFGRDTFSEPFSASFDISTLDGANGFVINGVAEDDRAGNAVSGIGDINQDGYDDFIISASNADPNGLNSAGTSYILFGKSSFNAAFNLSDINGSNGFALNGISAGDDLGASVDAIGDVNFDGYDDFIVGSEEASTNGLDENGQAYVIFGSEFISA